MMNNFLKELAEGKSLSWFLFILISLAVLFIVAAISFCIGKFVQNRKNALSVRKEREDAIKRSRSVIGGQISEQLAPFLPNFPCNPGDVRFVGKPIDFVGFPGATDGKSIEEILIIEVKTGKAQLNEREKQIKEAVEKGKVRYVVYRC